MPLFAPGDIKYSHVAKNSFHFRLIGWPYPMQCNRINILMHAGCLGHDQSGKGIILTNNRHYFLGIVNEISSISDMWIDVIRQYLNH